MPDPQPKFKLFVSYSHTAKPMVDQLMVHLEFLKSPSVNLVDIWIDKAIQAGEEWDDSIKEELESADIILLLINASFLISNYINKIELKRAVERHIAKEARVIPVILSHCDWDTLTADVLDAEGKPFKLSRLQAVRVDGKPLFAQHPEGQDYALNKAYEAVKNSIKNWKEKKGQ